MKVIGFVNQKGGVGKTTFLINTAFALSQMGKKVFILDTDPQASVCNFMDHRESLSVSTNIDYSSAQISALKTALKNLSHYDVVLVDTAGNASAEALKATIFMNNIVLPMQSSWLDINSATSFIEAISAYQIKTPFKIIINGVNSSSTSIARKLQEYFIKQHIGIFNSYICYRKPYKDSIFEGKSIVETLEAKNTAIIEFNKYISELLIWIEGN
ncbi:ParA family protein [Candidatus Hepatincolaceae symbiont of Richtersius coronifer]